MRLKMTHSKIRPLVVSALLLLGSTFAAADSGPVTTLSMAQCRFRDGSKILLTNAGDKKKYHVIFRTTDGQNDLSIMTVDESGHRQLETNGGVMRQVAINRAFD